MKKKSCFALAFLSALFLMAGCSIYAKKKYGLERKFNFTSRDEYFRQIAKENAIDTASLRYLDSASYIRLASGFSGAIYFGSYINDSVSIQKATYLMDNQSCIGRVGGEIERIVLSNRIDTMEFDTTVNLRNFNFYTALKNTGTVLVDKNKKLTIVLIYFYGFGTYYRSLYKEIREVQQKHAALCDMYVVSLDPVCYLKN